MPTEYRVDWEKSCAALKHILLKHAPAPGSFATAVQGLMLHRKHSWAEPKPSFYDPVIIVVAQGRKRVRIGNADVSYGDRSCFIAGVNMPVSSCVMEASEEVPYLSLSLNLDRSLIATLAAKVPPMAEPTGEGMAGAVVQELDPGLLDAFLRLLELADKPEQAEVLGNLIIQEIHFRLLSSPFGNQLRMLNTFGFQSNGISRAIAWLKENYKEPLQVDELAGSLNMAASTFHKHFKEITTLSPLQYQKRLRLAEAQRLMLSQGYDVAGAAFAVGYESATQFNREYKRLFGEPPRKDIMRLKLFPANSKDAAA